MSGYFFRIIITFSSERVKRGEEVHFVVPFIVYVYFDSYQFIDRILDSGNAFFNIFSDIQTCQDILTALHVRYIFTKNMASDREVVCQLNVFGQSIYLTKLIEVPENVSSSRKWHQFAYAIATSGSTGIPKIIKVPHSSILPNITDLKRILDMTEHDKIAQLTSFTFDPCIVEIFLSLSCAGILFMVSKQLKNEANR